MKKKWIALGTTLVLAAALAMPAMAANGIREIKASLRPDITIVLDGKEQTLKTTAGETVYPLLYDGTTYLPLRAIGQIMEKDVAWDNETKTIILTSDGYTVDDVDSSKGSKDIGLEKAKKIALEDAGLKERKVIFVTAKADFDDGRKEYEVEFYCDGTEYDYEIDAATGKILKAEKDIDD